MTTTSEQEPEDIRTVIAEAEARFTDSRLGKSWARETDKDLVVMRKLIEAVKAANDRVTALVEAVEYRAEVIEGYDNPIPAVADEHRAIAKDVRRILEDAEAPPSVPNAEKREAMAVARNIVNQIGDLWREQIQSDLWVSVRQQTNDQLDKFVAGLILGFSRSTAPDPDREKLIGIARRIVRIYDRERMRYGEKNAYPRSCQIDLLEQMADALAAAPVLDEARIAEVLRGHFPQYRHCGGCDAKWHSGKDFQDHQAEVIAEALRGQ